MGSGLSSGLPTPPPLAAAAARPCCALRGGAGRCAGRCQRAQPRGIAAAPPNGCCSERGSGPRLPAVTGGHRGRLRESYGPSPVLREGLCRGSPCRVAGPQGLHARYPVFTGAIESPQVGGPWSPRRGLCRGSPPIHSSPRQSCVPHSAGLLVVCHLWRGWAGLGSLCLGREHSYHSSLLFSPFFFFKHPDHAGETTAHCVDGPWAPSPARPWPPQTLSPQQMPMWDVFSHVQPCTPGLLLAREVDLAARLLPVSQQGESVPRRAQRQLCPQHGHRRAGTPGGGASTLPFSLAEREFPVSVACPVPNAFVSLSG
ncbi:uncharacterized protein LOC134522303 isoform X1 [Chroicocephalus ridibundus]|uniref:uncharacterized protein LOC134522303 isoform X1 n=1 Tax=Chroicocephalus ridibundus TaxID=1192867 RepID=UPI002FDCE0BF